MTGTYPTLKMDFPAKVGDFDIQHGLQKIQDGAFFVFDYLNTTKHPTKTPLLVSKPPFSAHLRQEVSFYVQTLLGTRSTILRKLPNQCDVQLFPRS